ncbi:MAG: hypothetical protein ACOWWR_04765 [Eubacteriales bacterium]
MNRIVKVMKYQMKDITKAIIVFYLVVLLLTVFFSAITFQYTDASGSSNISMGGFGMTTAIFIFIAGLNCFKVNFKFSRANNVSRKTFYYGTILALLIFAVFMAFIDTLISGILNTVLNISYESLHEQLYQYRSPLAEFIWSFGLYAFFVNLGWLITMIYYRSNVLMKVMVSISPIVFIMLFQFMNHLTNGILGKGVLNFFNYALGFYYNHNSMIGGVSFIIGSIFVIAFCYLLIRRAPIRD